MSHDRKSEGTGEDDHVRSDRCITINGLWYVATREGVDVGPFESKSDAEAAAREIAVKLADVTDSEAALTFVRQFARRPTG
jgi:Domain of unknown function (DUF6316)